MRDKESKVSVLCCHNADWILPCTTDYLEEALSNFKSTILNTTITKFIYQLRATNLTNQQQHIPNIMRNHPILMIIDLDKNFR